jgi:CHAT domain-containing protein/tetratricopeptide (TPR) repeat protein
VINLDDTLRGEFELEVSAGKTGPLDHKASEEEDMAYWRAIEDRAREQGDAVREAIGLNGRATILQNRGAYVDAKTLFERSLSLCEKHFGPNDQNVATAVNNLALLLQLMGNFTEAESLFERCLAIWEKERGPEDPDVATALHNLAIVHQQLGEYGEAQAYYERALAIREKVIPEDPVLASTVHALGLLLQAQGLFVEARPLLERGRAIREAKLGPDHPLVANSLTGLGSLSVSLGDYAGAKIFIERALAIREKQLGTEHPLYAKTLNTLAGVHAKMNDYAGAQQLLERSLAISEKQLGADHPDVMQTRSDMADLFVRMRSYAAADSLHTLVLAMREKKLGTKHPSVAANLSSLAAIARARGDYAQSETLYARVLAIHEELFGAEHPDVAKDLTSLAQVRALSGRNGSALDDALRAEELGRNHLRLTARVLSERQALQYASVRAAGLDVAMSVVSRDDPQAVRRTWDSLVRSRALVLDEMAERHRTVTSTTDPEVARLAETLSKNQARLANLLVRGPGTRPAEEYRQMLEDAREHREAAERALAEASTSFAQKLSQARFGMDDVVKSLPVGSALVAFAAYNKIDLTPKSPTKLETDSPEESRSIPSYLAFVLTGEQDPAVIEIGTAKTIDAAVGRWRDEASRGLLRSGRSSKESQTAYAEVGSALRRAVWDPLIPALRGATRVFVVPDGSLNLVNLAAFPMDDGSYLVESGPPVHLISAERDLVPSTGFTPGEGLLAIGKPDYDATAMFASLEAKHSKKATESPQNASVAPSSNEATPILLASAEVFRGQHSDCGQFSSMRFQQLPATGKEAKEIVELWDKRGKKESTSRVEPLFLHDAEASEATLKKSAAGHRVLHLATHGFFLSGDCTSALESGRGIGSLQETPATNVPTSSAPVTSAPTTNAAPPSSPDTGENPLLLSGLVLAGANHRAAAAENEDDGILTAEEIASLDLSGVEWAVLSACETGVGDIRVGEGVFGLRRTFQIAGAGTLIMSLWSVDDESTRSWMKALYEARLNAQLDTAESVRKASLAMLHERRARKQSTHPFYWAAFVAAGDWH